jgi:2-polyprenyl-3-methyl-5-hydroxy-6-metoxy-1,4-benzoquinol methylase
MSGAKSSCVYGTEVSVSRSEPGRLRERTLGGLHDFLFERVLPTYLAPGISVADLGAGTGALAQRLQNAGCEVVPVELDVRGFEADIPCVPLDLNDTHFAQTLGRGRFKIVTSIEVIEHLEAPINFLRNIRYLLDPQGVAILTTPNVENAPARVKFFLTARIRSMDSRGDATHITPIFLDLLKRQYLPRAGLRLTEHYSYPPDGFRLTRPQISWVMRLLGLCMGGEASLGDVHVLVLRPDVG